MPKDSLGRSSGSSMHMPTAPSCETLTGQDQQDSPVGSKQSQAQMTLEVSCAEMTGMHWSASSLCTEFYLQSIFPSNAQKAIKAFLFFNKLAF